MPLWLRRAVVPVGIVVGALVLTPTAAFAHASLEGTDPAAGAVLGQPPSAIELRFTEPVTVRLDGVRVYDAGGERVATDPPRKPTADVVRVAFRSRLAAGSYVVTWRVTSADTHPVQGAYTFQVGAVANASSREIDSLSNRLLAEQGGSRGVGVAWGVTRWLVFASIALLVGGVLFGVAIWSQVRDQPATRRIITASWGVLTVATIVGFVLQGPYASGLGLDGVLDPGLWREVAGTRFGTVWLVRLGLLVVAFALLRWWFRHRPAAEHPCPRWWLVAAAVVGLGIVASPALAGHAAAGDHRVVAALASTLHVAAMSAWLGGLVMMGVVVLRGSDLEALRPVVERFSRVALGCVVALVASGAFQTWRDVRSLDGLRSTDFGRILVIKVVVFAVMVVFAAFSRDFARRLRPVPEPMGAAAVPEVAVDLIRQREWRDLRRSVLAEAVLGLVVLAVTAALVNATPPVSLGASGGGAAGVTLRAPQVTVDVTVTPAVAGLNDVHVSVYSRAGAPQDVPEVTVMIDQPARDIAPIAMPLRKLGPGHYLSPGFDIPLAGDWRVAARVRLTDVDLVTLTGTIPIG